MNIINNQNIKSYYLIYFIATLENLTQFSFLSPCPFLIKFICAQQHLLYYIMAPKTSSVIYKYNTIAVFFENYGDATATTAYYYYFESS